MSAQDEIERLKMTKDDQALVRMNDTVYRKALPAAALKLREDRRFLGAIKLREHTAELSALQAISSEPRHLTKAQFEALSFENEVLYNEGLVAATEAAKAAIAGCEIIWPAAT
jgi:hypothetical protein